MGRLDYVFVWLFWIKFIYSIRIMLCFDIVSNYRVRWLEVDGSY